MAKSTIHAGAPCSHTRPGSPSPLRSSVASVTCAKIAARPPGAAHTATHARTSPPGSGSHAAPSCQPRLSAMAWSTSTYASPGPVARANACATACSVRMPVVTGRRYLPSRSARARPDRSDLDRKPRGAVRDRELVVVQRVARRDQDDVDAGLLPADPPRDLEAADVRQADVEQDEVGSQLAGGGQRGRAVGGLADDGPAVALQRAARHGPEAGVVVDDEDGAGHGLILSGLPPGG